MIEYIPERRVTCESALEHAYFADAELPPTVTPFTAYKRKKKGGGMRSLPF